MLFKINSDTGDLLSLCLFLRGDKINAKATSQMKRRKNLNMSNFGLAVVLLKKTKNRVHGRQHPCTQSCDKDKCAEKYSTHIFTRIVQTKLYTLTNVRKMS